LFVSLSLLQNPERYGLNPDGDLSTSHSRHIVHPPANSEFEGEELVDTATRCPVVESDDTAASLTAEQTGRPKHLSGVQADAASANSDASHGLGVCANSSNELEGLTLKEALKRPIFWLILLSIFFIDVLWGGFNLHFVSVLEDQGLGRNSGASTFLATSIAAALSSLLCGPFFDRLPVGLKVNLWSFNCHSS
jgi:hypothetical protein